MSVELHYLAWSCLLGLVHVFLSGMATTTQHGMAYGLSARDEKREVTGIGGRVQRALANYMQTFPFFAAAVLMVHLLDRHSASTEIGARLYFWARLAFVPLYAFNVTGVRTIAWGIAMVGIFLVLFGTT